MKDFIKNVLATMVGMFGFFIVMGVIGMMSIIGMIASGNAAQNVEKNSVFVLNLSGTISEQGSENPLSMFTGDNSLNSYDSRYWGVVPAAKLCGVAGGVFWPFTHRWGPIE